VPSEYRPRLSIEISDEQFSKLSELIPWGLKNYLFRVIIDDLINVLEKHGSNALAAIIDHKVKLEHYTRINNASSNSVAESHGESHMEKDNE